MCIILGIYCTDILNLEEVGTQNRMISGNTISVYCFWYIWTAFQMLAIYIRSSSTQLTPHYSVQLNTPFPHLHLAIRDHYVDAPSQLKTTLQCNGWSHTQHDSWQWLSIDYIWISDRLMANRLSLMTYEIQAQNAILHDRQTISEPTTRIKCTGKCCTCYMPYRKDPRFDVD